MQLLLQEDEGIEKKMCVVLSPTLLLDQLRHRQMFQKLLNDPSKTYTQYDP